MKVVLLIGLLVGLVFATGATAMALVAKPEKKTTAPLIKEVINKGPAKTSELALGEPELRPVGEQFAKPLAQSRLASVNGLAIQNRNPTCGVPFTVHVNVANQSGLTSLPGTVSLQNTHRGTDRVNYTGSQSYPDTPPGGNYVVVFQVLINSYVSRGQRLMASTNGSTFSLSYDLNRGNCPRSSSSTPPSSSTGQSLQVRHSGKCLDVPGGSRNSVTPVQQYSCTGNDNQTWRVESAGGSYYRLVSGFSGMCLDVQGFSRAPQGIIQQHPCNGGDNQRFSFSSTSGNYSLIVVKHSGLCLDVRGASSRNQVAIQQFPCSGNDNQQWRIR